MFASPPDGQMRDLGVGRSLHPEGDKSGNLLPFKRWRVKNCVTYHMTLQYTFILCIL